VVHAWPEVSDVRQARYILKVCACRHTQHGNISSKQMSSKAAAKGAVLAFLKVLFPSQSAVPSSKAGPGMLQHALSQPTLLSLQLHVHLQD
jgi:hypothetical protein